MKIVALEEHFTTQAAIKAWQTHARSAIHGALAERLLELGELRLSDMDEDGVDVQVISLAPPGVQVLQPADAVAVAREANDIIADTVAANPKRFQGFATLPTPDPAAAVTELHRCVEQLGLRAVMLYGRTGDRNVDHPDYADLWAAAADLGVPVYIHPTQPSAAVRAAYYSGLGDELDAVFATSGIGWHYETGVQLLRLIYAGVFDRNPELQVILGHFGEVVLFFAERIRILDKFAPGLNRPLEEYLRSNVYYTPSGVFSHRYLRWTIEVVGADRVMYSTDYPYVRVWRERPGASRRFLEESGLSDADKEKIAHDNWELLTRTS